LKTSAATPPDLARSVIAVPPLARLPNFELNLAANRALIRHLEEGGVTTLMPLEDLRDALSPIRVLHEAVTLASIADMGPILPPLSNIDADHRAAIRAAAQKLLATDHALARTPATVGTA